MGGIRDEMAHAVHILILIKLLSASMVFGWLPLTSLDRIAILSGCKALLRPGTHHCYGA
jgi:hypothetical protein